LAKERRESDTSTIGQNQERVKFRGWLPTRIYSSHKLSKWKTKTMAKIDDPQERTQKIDNKATADKPQK